MVQAEREVSSIRGRIDIIASICVEARKGTKQTRIMYACNLSFRQLKVYLRFLVKKGFLSVSGSVEGEKGRFFVTTEKGLAFLRAYEGLQAVISS